MVMLELADPHVACRPLLGHCMSPDVLSQIACIGLYTTAYFCLIYLIEMSMVNPHVD